MYRKESDFNGKFDLYNKGGSLRNEFAVGEGAELGYEVMG